MCTIRTRISPNESPENVQALMRENESADVMARAGYNIEQNPRVPGNRNPDYLVSGIEADNYAPSTASARNIWENVRIKVATGQARRIVLNLNDSAVLIDDLIAQFLAWPIQGLQRVYVVRNGRVSVLW